MSNNKVIGVTDLPIQCLDDDALQVDAYIRGLTEFISNCNTPMTIAIQGDWGTGKTSFINLVNDKIEKSNSNKKKGKVHTIIFNTWKYSQFNQKQNLSISFLSYIVSQIIGKSLNSILKDISDKVEDQPEDIERLVKNLGNLARNFTLDIIGQRFPRTAGNDTQININDQNNEFYRSAQLDSAAAIEELKESFEDAVKLNLKKKKADRIVIFIDDLDRLDPVIAVDLLEIIKLFLDVPQCVFVLAVDYNVVSKGVKLKQGDLEMDDEKAHSFFDKMIQVPFRIPKEFYNFEKFLNNNLPSISNLSDLQAIIQYSVGNNPRSVKRLLNSYHLISSIIFEGNNKIEVSNKQNGLLLSILCMQLAHEPLYIYFCANLDNQELLIAPNEKEMESLLKEADIPFKDENLRKHFLFLKELSKYIFDGEVHNLSDDITEDKLTEFSIMLSHSTITSEKVSSEEGNIKDIKLSEIEDYQSGNYRVNTITCDKIKFTKKSTVGRVFDIYEHVVNKNSDSIAKLEDYRNLPAMEEAGIEPRLILPALKIWDEDEEAREWIKNNAKNYIYQKDKYVADLAKRNLPGSNYEIIINYSAVKTVQNLYSILSFIDKSLIEDISVSLIDNS